jgi:hypothetical protein
MWRSTEERLPFDQIVDVAIDTFMGGKWGRVVTCRLSLVTHGASVPLSSSFQSGVERYVEIRDAMVAAIFANRPVPPEFDLDRARLASGQLADGITVVRRPHRTVRSQTPELDRPPSGGSDGD